jgi:hypothetical protein
LIKHNWENHNNNLVIIEYRMRMKRKDGKRMMMGKMRDLGKLFGGLK